MVGNAFWFIYNITYISHLINDVLHPFLDSFVIVEFFLHFYDMLGDEFTETIDFTHH